MSKVDKNLAEILETEYIPAEKEERKAITIQVDQETSENPDAEYSRVNYYNLIEKGNEALEGILEVAKESNHPRAYEVAANMIKNLSDVTEKLMVLQKQQRELAPREAAAPTSINVEKAVFVGSTADLFKKIKQETSEL